MWPDYINYQGAHQNMTATLEINSEICYINPVMPHQRRFI